LRLEERRRSVERCIPLIVPRADGMDLSVKRRQHRDRQADLVIAAVLVGHLAWHVLREFRFSTTPIEEALSQIPQLR
jgi:hypothetical protein